MLSALEYTIDKILDEAHAFFCQDLIVGGGRNYRDMIFFSPPSLSFVHCLFSLLGVS